MKRLMFAVVALLACAGAGSALAQYSYGRTYTQGQGQARAYGYANPNYAAANTWAYAPRSGDYALAQSWADRGLGYRPVYSEAQAGRQTSSTEVVRRIGHWEFYNRYGYFPVR
jgi:hypothetical protein